MKKWYLHLEPRDGRGICWTEELGEDRDEAISWAWDAWDSMDWRARDEARLILVHCEDEDGLPNFETSDVWRASGLTWDWLELAACGGSVGWCHAVQTGSGWRGFENGGELFGPDGLPADVHEELEELDCRECPCFDECQLLKEEDE